MDTAAAAAAAARGNTLAVRLIALVVALARRGATAAMGLSSSSSSKLLLLLIIILLSASLMLVLSLCHYNNFPLSLLIPKNVFACHEYTDEIYKVLDMYKNNSSLINTIINFCEQTKLFMFTRTEFVSALTDLLQEPENGE